MIGHYESWICWLMLGGIFGLAKNFRGCPSTAIGAGMAVAAISATWVSVDIKGSMIDCRVALAVLLLVLFCVHPLGRFRFTWNWLDTSILSFAFWGCVSDWRHSEGIAGVPTRLYGEVLLPYFAGRFLSMRSDSIRHSSTWFCFAGLIIAAGSVFESFTSINLWEWLFAPTDDLVKRIPTSRYDLLYRAAGPTRHPIFLAVLMILFFPWAASLAFRTAEGGRRTLGFVSIFVFVLGVLSTVSRGPLIGLFLSLVCSVGIVWPRLAKWLLASVACTTLGLALLGPQFATVLELTDPDDVRTRVIEVANENVIYSGTRNRLLVWEIYAPLLIRGGPMGFGTQAVSTFPPNIPGLPASTKARETLGIVDNSYLLTGLRFGWIGLSLFLVLIFGSIVMAIRLRRSAGMILYPDGPAFLTALSSCLIGVSFVMLTVFSSFDFMFWVYFHCGVVAGLASLRDSMLRGDIDVAA